MIPTGSETRKTDFLAFDAQKTATYFLSVPLFDHFSFSPMEISVTDFPALIGDSIFKLCVHLQVGKMYCVNEN